MTRSALVIFYVAIFTLYSCEAQLRRCRGGRHDVFTKCGSNCEPSCSQPYTGPCNRACAINICRCQPGFYRRESDQHCVTLDECRSSQDHPPHGRPLNPPFVPHDRPPYPPYDRPPRNPFYTRGRPPYPPYNRPPPNPFSPHGRPPYSPYGRPPSNPYGPHGRPPYPPYGEPQRRPYDFARSN